MNASIQTVSVAVMDKEIIIPRTCTDCGKVLKFKIKVSDYRKWKHDWEAYPYLSDTDRIILRTKTCGCNLFGEEF